MVELYYLFCWPLATNEMEKQFILTAILVPRGGIKSVNIHLNATQFIKHVIMKFCILAKAVPQNTEDTELKLEG